MPRRNRPPRSAAARPQPDAPRSVSSQRRDFWRGVAYVVRTVPADRAVKTYRCPGCDQEIRGVPHVVCWPENDLDAGERRHWHTACWAARDTRSPTR
jgi:hypothetical protein